MINRYIYNILCIWFLSDFQKKWRCKCQHWMTFYTFYDNEWAQKHICSALILAAMELANLRVEGLLERESWSLPNPARVQRNSFLKAAWTFGLFGAIALLLSRMSEPFCPNKTPRKTLGTFWSSYICWLNGFLVWHKLSETCEKRWRRLHSDRRSKLWKRYLHDVDGFVSFCFDVLRGPLWAQCAAISGPQRRHATRTAVTAMDLERARVWETGVGPA